MSDPAGAHGPLVVPVRVRPGAPRPRVGGSREGALLVAVTARAVDGAATAAVLRAVAAALGVPRSAVTLRHGARSRDKLLDVDTAAGSRRAVEARLALLLADGG